MHWAVILDKVIVPMIVSPLTGSSSATSSWSPSSGASEEGPGADHRRFRMLQTVSAAAMALGHGLQDAQKTMGVIVLALVAGGFHTRGVHPVVGEAVRGPAISAGTYSGGWRIMRTLGRRIIHLDPGPRLRGRVGLGGRPYVAALGFHAPISTTHTISSAIMGVGATKRLSAVRWGVARSMVGAWVLTLPAAGLVAARSTSSSALPLTPRLPAGRREGGSSTHRARRSSRRVDDPPERSGTRQPKRPEM